MVAAEVQARLATSDDADEIAALLHAFNREFGAASPGVDILSGRLQRLLSETATFAVIAGEPALAVALVTLRTNVWYDSQVALLDELYVVPQLRGHGIGSRVMDKLHIEARRRSVALVQIGVDECDIDAQRFYERQGYAAHDPDSGERGLWYFRELKC